MSKKNLDSAAIDEAADTVDVITEGRRQEALVRAGALQNAIFNSANFSSIATDAKCVIQIFNVGAERMLGYTAADVMNKITPADISDPQEVIARAKTLSLELATPIAPGFEALVFKASRGIEDIYELTYIRKDGSRFPAVVSVTALRDAQNAIIGYLLIGTDNTARKQAEEALLRPGPCKAPFSTAPTSRASPRTRRASFRSSTSALSAMAFLKLDNIDVRLHSASRGAGSCFHPPPHPESRIARAPKAPASGVLRQRDGGGTTGRIPSSTMGITHQRIGLTLKGISSNHTLKRETMASFNRLLRARDSPPICCCFFDHHDIQYDL